MADTLQIPAEIAAMVEIWKHNPYIDGKYTLIKRPNDELGKRQFTTAAGEVVKCDDVLKFSEAVSQEDINKYLEARSMKHVYTGLCTPLCEPGEEYMGVSFLKVYPAGIDAAVFFHYPELFR
jgi:hypothetical protein